MIRLLGINYVWSIWNYAKSHLLDNEFLRIFKVPTINQETAVASTEPIDLLKKFRSSAVLRPRGKTQATKVSFGAKDFQFRSILKFGMVQILNNRMTGNGWCRFILDRTWSALLMLLINKAREEKWWKLEILFTFIRRSLPQLMLQHKATTPHHKYVIFMLAGSSLFLKRLNINL